MRFAGSDDAVDRGEKGRVLELSGDAEKVAEVEMAEPERIHTRHRGDGVDVGETFGGFDLRNHHRPIVQRSYPGHDIARLVVVMCEPKRCAAAPDRRVTRAGHDVLGLVGIVDHRHHHAEGPNVERAGNERIFAARHANHGNDAEAAA